MTQIRHKHRHQVAYFKETTVCQAPADWAGDGIPLGFRDLDISGIKSTYVNDPMLEEYYQAVDTRDVLEGARNNEFKFSVPFSGLGTSPAVDAQALATPYTDLYTYSLGGSSYSNTTTLTGGTSAIPIFDEVTNIAAGQVLGFVDTTSPTKAGQVYFAEVASINEMTKAVTLSSKLPFTPANGDSVLGGFTGFKDEIVLEDAATNLKTLAFHIQLHPSDPHYVYETRGGVVSMAVAGIERNAPPKAEFTVMSANYKYSDADGLANVVFEDEPFVIPPLATHELRISIGDAADDENVEFCVTSFAIDLGVERSPVETITESTLGFDGLCSYTVKMKPAEVTVVLPGSAKAWYQGLKAQTNYRICLYQGSKGAGKSWAVYLPKCQIVETPAKAEAGEALGVQIKFRAKVGPATSAMTLSSAKIAIA